jgi:hypothetical protein
MQRCRLRRARLADDAARRPRGDRHPAGSSREQLARWATRSEDVPPRGGSVQPRMRLRAEKQITRRLAHVIVSVPGEAPHPVGLRDPPSQDDHGPDRDRSETRARRTRARGREGRARCPSRVPRAAQGWAPHLDHPHALGRTGGARHSEAVRRDVLRQEGARGVVVLHDQNQALLAHTRKKYRAEESRPGRRARIRRSQSQVMVARAGWHITAMMSSTLGGVGQTTELSGARA